MTKFVTALRILGDHAKADIALPLAQKESSTYVASD